MRWCTALSSSEEMGQGGKSAPVGLPVTADVSTVPLLMVLMFPRLPRPEALYMDSTSDRRRAVSCCSMAAGCAAAPPLLN